jgi:hypothetical protein
MKNNSISTIEQLMEMKCVRDKDIINLLLCTAKEISNAFYETCEHMGFYEIMENCGCSEERAEEILTIIDSIRG